MTEKNNFTFIKIVSARSANISNSTVISDRPFQFLDVDQVGDLTVENNTAIVLDIKSIIREELTLLPPDQRRRVIMALNSSGGDLSDAIPRAWAMAAEKLGAAANVATILTFLRDSFSS